MNLTEITQAFVDLLSEVDGVRGYAGLQDSILSSSGTATAVVVRPGEPYIASYHRAMSGGQAEINFVFEIVVPRTSIRAAQERVNQLLSSGAGESRSLIDAVRPSDLPNTLGGLIDDFKIETVSGLEERIVGEQQYIGCDLEVMVLARRVAS